jgi:hypothetical protein
MSEDRAMADPKRTPLVRNDPMSRRFLRNNAAKNNQHSF